MTLHNKWMAIWLLGGFMGAGAFAQDADMPPGDQGAAESEVSHVDAMADARVKAMSDFLTKQQKLRFMVEITYDAVESDGQKYQLGRRSRVEVIRPDHLRAEVQGDRGVNQLSVFDGKHFLFHDRAHQVYSRIETPPTLAAFFDFLFEKYGASPPVADFLLPNVHEALTAEARSGAMLGDAFVVEQECDHVVFSGDVLDWQIWIQKGNQPWPRKFVITYKDVEVRPQFMAVFREWAADDTISPGRFDTAAPSGATEVPLERPEPADEDEASDDGSESD